MRTSYSQNDVTVLLKDITGLVQPLPSSEREKLIQSGVHYCEMLPLEYVPSEKYMNAYNEALKNYAPVCAEAVAVVAELIYKKHGAGAALVSLARAGTPIGILIKRYLERKYTVEINHYTISIIRGRGIDRNAMRYILARHNARDIQFVDGWTGKGAILDTLKKELFDFKEVSAELAVLSDPAWITELCGTHEDFLIPSSCLNSTVSGLMSRTFLRSDLIGADDFHGAMFYESLKNEDLSYSFIDTVEKYFRFDILPKNELLSERYNSGVGEVRRISERFGVSDINLIKPGIGEATRVLLRRVPWKILVRSLDDEFYLGHIYRLAEEKNVPIEVYPLKNYRACGIIKSLADT